MFKYKKRLFVSAIISVVTLFLLFFVKSNVNASSLLSINNKANSSSSITFKEYSATTIKDLYVYHYGYNNSNHKNVMSKKSLKSISGYEGTKNWYYKKLLKKGSKIIFTTPGFKEHGKKYFTVEVLGKKAQTFQEGKGIYNAINIQSIHQLKNVKKSKY